MNRSAIASSFWVLMVALAIHPIAQATQSPVEQQLCVRSAALRADPYICLADGNLAVIATADLAVDYLNALKEARQRYETHLGPIPAPLVLVVGSEPTGAELERLRSDGILVLPWLDLAERLAGMEEEVRRQIGEQMPNLNEAQRGAIVAQLLARIRPSVADGGHLAPLEAGIIQHEVAHQWFGRLFTRGAGQPSADGTPEYGSPAPDWLDEIVAILAETDALTAQRRTAMIALVRQNRMPTVAALLAMRHPWTLRPGSGAAPDPAGAGARVTLRVGVQSEQTRSSEPSVQDFYVFCRAFADFLIERSRDPHIVRAIALHLQGNGSFESWMGGQSALGVSTIAELEAQWREWLRQRAEAAPPASS